MSDFPRTALPGTMFKVPLARKVRSTLKRRIEVNDEQRQMRAVRQEDRFCRFPWCGCRKFKLALHVAHTQHRGMGGNPKGDRSDPKLMILLCSARHRENLISLDGKTARIEPLTPDGMRGPVRWLVDMRAFHNEVGPAKWVEVAREKARHTLEPPSVAQQEILNSLAEMLI